MLDVQVVLPLVFNAIGSYVTSNIMLFAYDFWLFNPLIFYSFKINVQMFYTKTRFCSSKHLLPWYHSPISLPKMTKIYWSLSSLHSLYQNPCPSNISESSPYTKTVRCLSCVSVLCVCVCVGFNPYPDRRTLNVTFRDTPWTTSFYFYQPWWN